MCRACAAALNVLSLRCLPPSNPSLSPPRPPLPPLLPLICRGQYYFEVLEGSEDASKLWTNVLDKKKKAAWENLDEDTRTELANNTVRYCMLKHLTGDGLIEEAECRKLVLGERHKELTGKVLLANAKSSFADLGLELVAALKTLTKGEPAGQGL